MFLRKKEFLFQNSCFLSDDESRCESSGLLSILVAKSWTSGDVSTKVYVMFILINSDEFTVTMLVSEVNFFGVSFGHSSDKPSQFGIEVSEDVNWRTGNK